MFILYLSWHAYKPSNTKQNINYLEWQAAPSIFPFSYYNVIDHFHSQIPKRESKDSWAVNIYCRHNVISHRKLRFTPIAVTITYDFN